MLEAARRLGAEQGQLLAYYTSGDITADHGSVVGYAAVAITKA
jgi:AmmeMemoRadiSam system protein B